MLYWSTDCALKASLTSEKQQTNEDVLLIYITRDSLNGKTGISLKRNIICFNNMYLKFNCDSLIVYQVNCLTMLALEHKQANLSSFPEHFKQITGYN